MPLSLLAAFLLLAPPASWEVRYGQQPDQKPEWTTAGYLPAWSIDWLDPTRPEVVWDEPDTGVCRGWLLFGQPYTPPAGAKSIQVTLDYRTSCAMDDPTAQRSGALYVILATREQWGRVSRTPAAAEVFDLRRDVLSSAEVKGQGADVLAWTAAPAVELPLRGDATDLLVGVAWAAYHFHAVERGGFRNLEVTAMSAEAREQQFWDALDLTRPDLAAVAAALAAGDREAARHALAEHFRQRETPVVADPVAPASDAVLKRADETLAHTYRLAGTPPYTFPDRIVWNADPHNYNQWAIALNRHFEWLHLAAAWLRTGDEKYAVEWQDQLLDWVAAMPVIIPPYIEGPYNDPGRPSLSLDAGIRMGTSWFPSFEVFRRAPSVSDEAILAFVRSARDHAGYLLRDENFKEGSNWGAMESNGLYHLGAMLPEFRDAGLWRETAINRLRGELDRQVYPDGAQHELAPGYHGVSLRNFLAAMELARANSLPVPEDYQAGLERMFDYYLKIARPDFRTPNLNDSGSGGIGGWLQQGYELFGQRTDFQWGGSNRAAGAPPDYTSLAMPYAGWVVMRSGWDADARWLLFDAGPFGTGHQHEDKLGLQVFAFGQPLLGEAGVYAYDTSDWRKYVLSTRAHSTVRVDGQDQNSRADRSTYRSTAPDTHGFVTGPNFDYAESTFDAGYGPKSDKSVTHRRRVLFVKPDYWLVIDDYTAADEAEHVAEAQFLLLTDGADLTTDGVAGRVGETGVGLRILPLHGDADLRIVSGQTEPEVLGWVPDGFNDLVPRPAVIDRTRFTAHATRAWILLPTRQGEPATSLERSGAIVRAAHEVSGPEGASKQSPASGEPLTATLTIAGATHRLAVTSERVTVDTPAGQFAAP